MNAALASVITEIRQVLSDDVLLVYKLQSCQFNMLRFMEQRHFPQLPVFMLRHAKHAKNL